MMNKLGLTSNMYGMDINEKETKVMLVKKESQEVSVNIIVNKHKLEQVRSFVYVSSIISDDGRCLKEINKRIVQAKNAFWNCKEFLRRDLSIKLKKRLLNYVKASLCYGGEAWTYNKTVCSKTASNYRVTEGCWKSSSHHIQLIGKSEGE